MTITLHWWIVPILIVVAAIVWGAIVDNGHSLDFVPGLIFLLGLVIALGVIVGHYL